MKSFHYYFVVPVIISGSILYGLTTNALPVTTQDINTYESGFPWQLSRLNGEETLPYNPHLLGHPNALVWPYRMDPRRQGDDSVIYILDSGVRSSHKAFRDDQGKTRVVDGGTFKGATGPATTDTDGQGTRMASMAAGKIRFGVATQAKIFSYKVADNVGGHVPEENMIAGIKAAIEHFQQKQPKIGVINISIGTMPLLEPKFRSDAFQKAVEDAIAIGMHVTLAAASGNYWEPENPSGRDHGERDWIYVGATDLDDNIVESSNHGMGVDIYAPGDNVIVAMHDDDDGYTTASGTAYGAPLVAGVIANIGTSDSILTRRPGEMKKYILKNSAIGKIRNLPNGSYNRILQFPILEN